MEYVERSAAPKLHVKVAMRSFGNFMITDTVSGTSRKRASRACVAAAMSSVGSAANTARAALMQ